MPITSSKYVGIDLFAGAGGMALGAKLAGIDIKMAIEIDRFSAVTHSFNNQETMVISKDIRDFGEKDLNLFNQQFKGKIKVLFGGPPCQGFSTSNIRGRKIGNAKNWLFTEYFRIIDIWKPDWAVIENVKGLIDTEGGFFLEKIIDQFSIRSYKTSHWILNSADYGVPQKRNRLFIIGSLHGKKIKAPRPTFKNYVTVNEAISDLPNLENGASENVKSYKSKTSSKYAQQLRGKQEYCTGHLVTRNAPTVLERYNYIHQGQNWQSIPDELMRNYKNKNNCHTGIYYRLKEDEPSVVLGNYRKNMLIHPSQNRGLSVREAARLQSFPDWFEFKGSIGFQQQQVGNAVPPLLAKAVFETILGVP